MNSLPVSVWGHSGLGFASSLVQFPFTRQVRYSQLLPSFIPSNRRAPLMHPHIERDQVEHADTGKHIRQTALCTTDQQTGRDDRRDRIL